MQKNLTPNKSAILAHLQLLFTDTTEYSDGLVEIAYTPNDTGAVSKAAYFSTDELARAAEFAYTTNAQEGVNVYVGAALRSPSTAPFGRSSAKDYYAATSIWADLDDAGAAKRAKDIYKELPPSLVVVTGRSPDLRAQAWWRLMHPEGDAQRIKDTLQYICNALGGDPAVADPARVMRLAGTIAWPKKNGRTTEITEAITPPNNTKLVMHERFKSYFPAVGASSPVLTAPHHATAGQVDKPRNPITGKLRIQELLERTRQPGHWHFNMRDAVAALVSSGQTDEMIRLVCAPYCTGGASDPDLTPLIYSARKKWDIPEKQPEYDQITGEIKAPQTQSALFYIPAKDIRFDLNDTALIKNVLGQEELSVIYGESNCGKTFFMTDLAFHIARGIPWRGNRVTQGGVMYAALEGKRGLSSRFEAYCKKHNIDRDIPFAVMPCALDFYSESANIGEFIDLIKSSQDDIGDPRLIVIDTLSRALAGGDENSGQDMGRLVHYADMIRFETKAHLSFVHHSGKNKALGARGHSSLRAAVDTEIEISREDQATQSIIRFVKQREMEMAEDMAFTLERVVIGINGFSEEITSCVVIPAEVETQERRQDLTPKQAFVYEALIAAIDRDGVERIPVANMQPVKCVSYDQFAESLERMGFGNMFNKDGEQTAIGATKETRIQLRSKNKIGFNNNLIWPLLK